MHIINYQGGDATSLPKSSKSIEIRSDKSGYLTNLSSLELAKLSMKLGAGRQTKEDSIDYSAGIIINKNINDKVEVGDVILTLYTNKDIDSVDSSNLFTISDNINDYYKLIYEIIE